MKHLTTRLFNSTKQKPCGHLLAQNLVSHPLTQHFSTNTTNVSHDTIQQVHKGVENIARVGICFDIDGVILRGSKLLSKAAEALHELHRFNIPYIFLTNGGGVMEHVKARQLTDILGIDVCPEQIILSHTPFRSLVPSYRKKKVLVIGSKDSINVAREYGFEKAYTPEEVARSLRAIYPFQKFQHTPLRDNDEDLPWSSILMFHDSIDWGMDLQITLDVIFGGNPPGIGRFDSKIYENFPCKSDDPLAVPLNKFQSLPVFVSNPDFVFAGGYAAPRYAQGAFVECLNALYKRTVNQDLSIKYFGKPTNATFNFAKYTLENWRIHLVLESLSSIPTDQKHIFMTNMQNEGHPMHSSDRDMNEMTQSTDGITNSMRNFDKIFMIGDNPEADIRGANNAGNPWKSILVRSGVFQGGENDLNDPAWRVVDGVYDAVQTVIEESLN